MAHPAFEPIYAFPNLPIQVRTRLVRVYVRGSSSILVALWVADAHVSSKGKTDDLDMACVHVYAYIG